MNRNTASHNRNLAEHNRLVNRYNAIRGEHNRGVAQINSLKSIVKSTVEIGGGIGLQPKRFTVRKARSAALNKLGSLSGIAANQWTKLPSGEFWARSRSSDRKDRPVTVNLGKAWVHDVQEKSATGSFVRYGSASGEKYWLNVDKASGGWRDQRTTRAGAIESRLFDPTERVLHIAAHRRGELIYYLHGQRGAGKRIIFRRSDRTNLLRPIVPPRWFKLRPKQGQREWPNRPRNN